MNPNNAVLIVTAKYASRSDAVDAFKTLWGAQRLGKFGQMARPLEGAKHVTRADFVEDAKRVWGARHRGVWGHMAVAVLTRHDDGQLQVERHDTTAKHFAWTGAVLGAAVVAAATPSSASFLDLAAGAVGLAAVGGFLGHCWHSIPKYRVAEMGNLLDSGESGLVIVVLTHKDSDISPLLRNTTQKVVVQSTFGELDADFGKAFTNGVGGTISSNSSSAAHEAGLVNA
jgi:hypothetical protein